MKIIRLTILLLSFTLMSGYSFSPEKIDITGTWEGESTLESQVNPNNLILKMVKEDNALKGNITDQYGVFNNTPLKEIKFKGDSLSFNLELAAGGGTIKLIFRMKVKGDKMEGKLEIPSMGDRGTWAAVRKKK
ncbi:hypothetical protein ACFL4T_02515 [candidate division KSB1 bacterium]